MANYDVSDFGVQSPFRPQEAIVSKSAASVVDVLGQAAEYGQRKVDNQAAATNSTVLDKFTEEQVLLADAVEQGAMTPAAARTAARANYLRYAANNPGSSPELLERNSKVLNQAGLGKVITTGTAEDQAREAVVSESIKEGWANPEEYVEHKQASRRLADAQKKLTFDSGMSKFEQDQLQAESKAAMVSLATTSIPKLRDDLTGIAAQVKGGQLSSEDAIAMIKGMEVSRIIQQSQVGAYAGSAFVSDILAPQKRILEDTVKMLDGSMDVELAEQRNKANMANAKAYWLSDPTVARIAAGTELLQHTDHLKLISKMDSSVIKKVSQLGNSPTKSVNLTSTDESDAEDNGYVLQALKGNLKDSLNKRVTEEQSLQIKQAVDNVLDSVDIYKGSAENAKAYNSLMDFWSSDEFARYAQTGLNSEKAYKAKVVMQENYEDEVIPLIKEEYESVVFTGGRKERGPKAKVESATTAVESIKPQFTGAGALFVIDESVAKEDRIDLQRKVKQLNTKVAPVLNRMLRASTHLGGTKNYKATYEELYSRIFGVEQEVTSDE